MWQADKDGQNAKQLAGGLAQFHVGYLAVDGANVYYPDLLGGTVDRVPIGGSGGTPLASNQSRPVGVAVDSTDLFWSNGTGNTIAKLTLGTTAVSQIATGLNDPNDVATDGTNVWINSGSGAVSKTAK